MTGKTRVTSRTLAERVLRLSAIGICGLILPACAQLGGGDNISNLLSASTEEKEVEPLSDVPLNDLQKATAYWAKEYQKGPQNLKAALAYAKNLKALGQKAQAFSVLQHASQFNTSSKELASEYGRLALELDQTTLAAQLLEYADDPTNPDWRVISARGAALAKQSKYKDAVTHLERAQLLAPDQVSVMNNLALAYTMNGEAAKAEELLRVAVTKDGANTKTKQNLALVLGLQGKYDEATQVGSMAVAADTAKANTDVLKQIVKLEPKKNLPPAPALPPFKTISADPTAIASAWSTSVASDTTAVPAPAH